MEGKSGYSNLTLTGNEYSIFHLHLITASAADAFRMAHGAQKRSLLLIQAQHGPIIICTASCAGHSMIIRPQIFIFHTLPDFTSRGRQAHLNSHETEILFYRAWIRAAPPEQILVSL